MLMSLSLVSCSLHQACTVNNRLLWGLKWVWALRSKLTPPPLLVTTLPQPPFCRIAPVAGCHGPHLFQSGSVHRPGSVMLYPQLHPPPHCIRPSAAALALTCSYWCSAHTCLDCHIVFTAFWCSSHTHHTSPPACAFYDQQLPWPSPVPCWLAVQSWMCHAAFTTIVPPPLPALHA